MWLFLLIYYEANSFSDISASVAKRGANLTEIHQFLPTESFMSNRMVPDQNLILILKKDHLAKHNKAQNMRLFSPRLFYIMKPKGLDKTTILVHLNKVELTTNYD